MNSYTLPARTMPLEESWEIIVVGGGPAGCTAAAAAAREGARTLLVEATGCLGGMGTSGLINQWMSFGDLEKMIVRGMGERVYRACKAGLPHTGPDDLWGPIDAERLKGIYDDLVTGHGATVLFNTTLTAVEAADGAVNTIVLNNKAGLQAYRAQVYVDATGDGDLAAWAGAEFLKGDAHGEMQPVTLCFKLTNVDMYAYLYGPPLWPTVITEIYASGRYPDITDKFMVPAIVGPRTIGFNAGHQWEVDSADPAAVSRALIQGRKMACAFRDALAEFHPRAFANAQLEVTGALLGIRETRRILGDYVLGVEDYLARRSFPDEICRNAYGVDVHPSKAEAAHERATGEDKSAHRAEPYRPGESHGIPYRCLTPRGLRNVLVAGRSISCDRAVQGAVRVMPICLGMGEAAGLAAALAAQGDGDVHHVNTRRLCGRLIEEGAYLPGAETEAVEV